MSYRAKLGKTNLSSLWLQVSSPLNKSRAFCERVKQNITVLSAEYNRKTNKDDIPLKCNSKETFPTTELKLSKSVYLWLEL